MPSPGSIIRSAGSILLALLAAAVPCGAAEPLPAAHIEFFETKIRPVLAEQCYACHNSTKSAKGGLALDDRASTLKGGTNGPIVVAGKPGKSRLLPILRHEVEGMAMPKNGPKLDKAIVADFEKWIALGLPDPREKPPSADELTKATSWAATLETRKKWWSFQPIQNPTPPVGAGIEWSKHPIDRFVAAKLREHKLEPGARADAGTLVRRLHFALTGLPPSVADQERWTAKLGGAGGYDELVEDLLGRPQFGEHWARHWMDWTRYADSSGSEDDPEIVNGWLYRDYLIRALNADVPYDQLVREHVAGDLLAKPRIDQARQVNESAIGPAHWRMVFHGFAPTDALEEKVRFTDDAINTFSKAFLGLTVSCARCHDHKFDAISQKDYYALFGVLASSRPGRAAIDTPGKLERHRDALAALKPKIRTAVADDWLAGIKGLRTALLAGDGPAQKADKPTALLHPLFQVRGLGADEAKFRTTWRRQAEAAKQEREARAEYDGRTYGKRWNLAKEADHAGWFRQGAGLPAKPSSAGEFAVVITGEKALAGLYPAGVYSHTLSTKHAARLESPVLKLDGNQELWLRVLGDGGATARYVVQDYPRGGAVFPVVKLAPEWHWQKFDLSYWTGDEIHIELSAALDAPMMVANAPRSWFGIREAVLVRKGEPGPPAEPREYLDPVFAAVADAPPKSREELADAYVRAISAAVRAWQAGTATDAQASLLAKCLGEGLLPNKLEELKSAKPWIAEYRRLEEEIAVPTRAPNLMEADVRNQPLYERGDHKRPAAAVPRRFLEAIDPTPYPGTGSGRLQLAEDLVSDKNPLTRRVIVNRLWHHLFGRGIVPTPDNFGRLGVEPTHPELLDFLATRFRAQGWSIKETIRFLVTSQTWQLASKPTAEARHLDPDNLTLSHALLRRLEAESIRDSLLAVSGSLRDELFGPPVDSGSPRRSLYVRVQRNALDPFLRAFDFPEPFSAAGRRDTTNVPAQSLTLMNDPRVAALASDWAAQILADPTLPGDEERIRRMITAALARPATAAEVTAFREYLVELRANRRQAVARATELRGRLEIQQTAWRDLLEPIRTRMQKGITEKPVDDKSIPQPIARWDFPDSLKDQVGSLHGEALGGAEAKGGALKVGEKAHVLTPPLQKTIREKTLEVWVRLDKLEQAGGGAMTIQTKDAASFDAIVFGEKDAGQWMAGSELFRRTQSFQGPKETEAVQRPVHLAIAYHADGRIVAYRDGRPYGKGYKSAGPTEFKAGEALIGFGIRHSPAGGNTVLRGGIVRARLYDRALSAEEVSASARSVAASVSDWQVLEALAPAERTMAAGAAAEIAALEKEIRALGPIPAVGNDRAVWTDIAKAIFCFKEFLYVK